MKAYMIVALCLFSVGAYAEQYMVRADFDVWNTSGVDSAINVNDVIELSVRCAIAPGNPPDVQEVIEEGYFWFTYDTDKLEFLGGTYYWVPLSCNTAVWDDPGTIFAYMNWHGDMDWPLWVYSAWWHSPTKMAGMKFRVIAPGNCVFHWLYADDCTLTTVFTLGRTQNLAGLLTDYTLPVGALRGDTSGDGLVDAQDIDGFLDAVFSPPPPGSDSPADMNFDGWVNDQDIDGFIDVLFGNTP